MLWSKRRNLNRRVAKRAPLYHMTRSMFDWFKLIGLSVGLVVLVGGTISFFVHSPFLKLKNVEVYGELTHLKKEQLIELARIPLGKNIVALNLFDLAQNMKRYPWIDEVQIRRKFPDTVVIGVKEYKPRAVLKVDEERFLVSESGVVFKRCQGEEGKSLVTIAGFKRERVEKSPSLYKPKLLDVLSFLDIFEKTQGMENEGLKEIRWDMAAGLELLLGDESSQKSVYLGVGDYDLKLKRLTRFLNQARRDRIAVRSLDLHVKDKVYARLNPQQSGDLKTEGGVANQSQSTDKTVFTD